VARAHKASGGSASPFPGPDAGTAPDGPGRGSATGVLFLDADGDGKRTAADANFANVKVLVTQADGRKRLGAPARPGRAGGCLAAPARSGRLGRDIQAWGDLR
jgi:hypothetical protein